MTHVDHFTEFSSGELRRRYTYASFLAAVLMPIATPRSVAAIKLGQRRESDPLTTSSSAEFGEFNAGPSTETA